MNTKITIKENRENMLFRRKEIKVDVESEVTPSRTDAKKIICDAVGCKDEDLIRIIKIDSKFGEKVFTIVAEVYNSKEDLNQYSPTLKKKDFEAEKKAAEESKKAVDEMKVPEEPKVEEAKPEENKEEKSEDIKEEKPEAKSEEKKE